MILVQCQLYLVGISDVPVRVYHVQAIALKVMKLILIN